MSEVILGRDCIQVGPEGLPVLTPPADSGSPPERVDRHSLSVHERASKILSEAGITRPSAGEYFRACEVAAAETRSPRVRDPLTLAERSASPGKPNPALDVD
jgi:hypothetical protein